MEYRIAEFLGMFLAIAALALLAHKAGIAYPILLVIGGLVLAVVLEFFPKLPELRLHPELVFLLFLPPLLYPAAVFTSWRDFRANLRPILQLAIGAVLCTTVFVAYFAHFLVKELPLAAAFILGAIVSPTDVVAATAITQRMQVPRRIVTILEGESMLNDAIGLVTYQFAVFALVSGSFSIGEAGLKFILVSLGGVLIGLAVGWLAWQAQRRLDDPPVEITLSILTPYVAYLPADQLGVSGVLAVVATGLFLGWRLPEIAGSRTRLQAGPVWEMIDFLLNGIVFIFIGLELPEVWSGLSQQPLSKPRLIGYGLLISAVVILARFVSVFAGAYLPRFFSRKLRERDPYPGWRSIVLIGWTGMRGVLSLAAALALPALIAGDKAPNKNVITNLIIFFTYVVILVTLVVQGLTLPFLIRWLNIEPTGEGEREEREARLKANLAAMARIAELEQKESFPEEMVQRLRAEYEDRIRQLETSEDTNGVEHRRGLYSTEYEHLQQEALDVERRTILRLRNERFINDIAHRRIQRDIDLAEARLHGQD